MPRTPNAVRTAQTRDQILDAATELIRRIGPARMTMDGVAAEAHVSKGGVLHHFPSKDALVAALAARVLDRMRKGVAEQQVEGTLRAMARHAQSTCRDEGGYPRALMLAAFEQPEALAGFRSFLSGQIAAIRARERQPKTVLVGLFAVIGLMLSRNLGLSPLDDAETEILLETIETFESDLMSPAVPKP